MDNLKFLSLLFLGVLLGGFSTCLYAQDDEEEVEQQEVDLRKISLAELMREVEGCDESEYILTEAEVVATFEDASLMEDKIFYTPYVLNGVNDNKKSLFFYDCVFKLPEASPLVFRNWNVRKLNFVNSTFEGGIVFENCKTNSNYPVKFVNDIFKDDVSFYGDGSIIDKLAFDHCTFSRSIQIHISSKWISFSNDTFDADTIRFNNRDEESTIYQMDLSFQNAEEVKIDNCRFLHNGLERLYSINMEGMELEKLNMSHLHLQSLNLTDVTINKSIMFDSVCIADYVGVGNFDFPVENTNVPWHNLKGEKICLFTNPENSSLVVPYKANSQKSIAQQLMYNDLMAAYNKFNSMYNTRGERMSANGCYVEIKDIETRRQKYLYQKDKNLNNLLTFRLNEFLKYYCDYATNPARSLEVSLYIVLFFAFIYLFIYSDWDNIDHYNILDKYKYLVDYFVSGKNLEDSYNEKFGDDILEYEKFKSDFINNGSKIPAIIRFWGLPLYYLWTWKIKLLALLFNRVEIFVGPWVSLSMRRKVFSGVVVTVLIITYILFTIFIKAFNSVLLSLNTFITIGFGELPGKGLSMYVAIVEGFLGWFMLAIFSITLLTQVLQSA